VVQEYPQNADAAYSLGLLLVEVGKPQEAVGYLQKAADGAPQNARVRYNLGLLLQQLGRLAEAERALSDALDLQPTSPDFLLALGDHYVRHGRAGDALAIADRLIRVAPQDPVGRQLRAMALQSIPPGR
jgi:Flp pilus assembly protein TadD